MTGGGGGGTQTTTTKLPKWVQPYAEDFLNRADWRSNRPYQAYKGDQVANINQAENLGMKNISDIATGGNIASNAGESYLRDVLGGKYLSPESNPYLQSGVQQAQQDVMTAMGGARRGAFGNTGMDYSLGKALGDSTNKVYSQNYDLERQRQSQAASMAPQYSQLRSQNAQNLLNSGNYLRNIQQSELDTKYQDWINKKNFPLQQLDVLGNALRTTMGGGGTSSMTGAGTSPNRFAGAAGGAMTGAQLGSMFMPGIGTGIGAVGGALLGGLL